jgi:hypothetical protein
MTQNCKIEFLDTHTGLTGAAYRSDQFGQNRNSVVMENEHDVDNHNVKPSYRVKLLSMSPIDRILELTDATGLTDFAYRSDRSLQRF